MYFPSSHEVLQRCEREAREFEDSRSLFEIPENDFSLAALREKRRDLKRQQYGK